MPDPERAGELQLAQSLLQHASIPRDHKLKEKDEMDSMRDAFEGSLEWHIRNLPFTILWGGAILLPPFFGQTFYDLISM